MNWGECFLNHYEKYLGRPRVNAERLAARSRSVFRSKPGMPSIQVLEYRDAFPGGARVYCTLGLSHFSAEVKGVSEVMLAVDAGYEAAETALANACFFAVDRELEVMRGMVIGGLETVAPQLPRDFGKNALYWADPYNLPAGAESVGCGELRGRLYHAFLISQAEREYLGTFGSDAFEAKLAAANVDPIAISRPSVI